MMTWNYRVFQEANGNFVIREVFYAEDGSILGCTENSVEPFGQSFDELASDIEYFKAALALPVLTLKDIPVGIMKSHRPQKHNTVSHAQLLVELGLEQPSPAS